MDPIGPNAAQVADVAIAPGNPQVVYVAAYQAGVFRSSDGGVTWVRTTQPASDDSIRAVAVPAGGVDTVYAGSSGDGVFRSVDGGATWARLTAALGNLLVSNIVTHPSDPDTLWAATWGQGVIRTTDGGGTWSAFATGLTTPQIYRLAVDPGDPQTLYAGTFGGGVFMSTDGGESWAPRGLEGRYVYAVTVDPADSSRVVAGVFQGGIWVSSDRGATWVESGTGMGAVSVNDVVVHPADSSIMYAAAQTGAFKSTDRGASWTQTGAGVSLTLVRRCVIDPTHSGTVLAGTLGGGMFRTTDGGTGWTPTNSGLAASHAGALALGPGSVPTLFAGLQPGGVYATSSRGASWTGTAPILASLSIYALAVDPTHPGTVLAGENGQGVFRSTDGGASWSQGNAGLTNRSMLSLAFDPASPATVLAGTSGGVFRSTDGGATWAVANVGLSDLEVYALAIDPNGSGVAFAGTNADGVFSSVDGGATWAPAGNDTAGNRVTAIAIDPSQSDTIFAATYSGTFKSTDGGATWSRCGTGGMGGGVRALVIDPDHPQTLFVGTSLSGVYRSSDGCASWSSLNSGLDNLRVKALALDPSPPATLFAATEYSGVYAYTFGSCPAPTGLANNTAADVSSCTRSGVRVQWTDPASWGDGGSGTRTFAVLRNGAAIASGIAATSHAYTDTSGAAGVTYTYAVRATNGCGASATTTGAAAADVVGTPTITAQPADVTILTGHTATLAVTAANATGTQWYRGSSGDTAHPIAGATSASYTTPALIVTTSYWVRVSNGCGSVDSATATVTVTDAPTAHTVMVPVVAHWPGAGGTAWRSDVSVVNRNAGPATVVLEYTSVVDSTTAASAASVPAGGTMMWRDVLVTAFGMAQSGTGKGTLKVASDLPVTVASRTYNQTPQGTFGQYMPSLEAGSALAAGEVGVLPHLTQNGAYRTHVGLANLSSGLSCSGRITLHDQGGHTVGSPVTLAVEPGRSLQQDYVFTAAGAGPQDVAYATVEVLTAGCRMWAYASVVDAATGDPTTIPVQAQAGASAASPALATTYVVPVVAHWPGAGDTAWRSDVSVVNRSATKANVTLNYASVTDTMTGSYATTVAAGATVMWRDVLVAVLGLAPSGTNKGTLQVVSNVPLTVASRTYNETPQGTFGQYIPALEAGSTVSNGQTGILPHLTQSAAYRTHVGFANLSATGSCTGRFRLFGPTGAALGSPVEVTAAAGRSVQRDYVFTAAGAGTADVAYATVDVVAGTCEAWAYASVVDAATGDPTTIPVQEE